jgi:hypothetical protein
MINLPRDPPIKRRRRLNHKLTLTAPIKRAKIIRGLVNSCPHTQQPVILQNSNLRILLDHARDRFALVGGEGRAPVIMQDLVGVVEAERVLHEGRQFLAEDGVGLAGYGVGVADGVDPGVGFVDLGVDGEAG